MSELSISQAWRETLSFVRAERRLLTPLVLATVALPSALVELIVPPATIGGPAGSKLMPEPGPWILPAILLLFMMLVGQLAVSRLALGWSGDLRGALRHALQRIAALIGANLLFGLAMTVPFILLISLAAVVTASSAGLGLIVAALIGIPFLILFARAAFVMPVAAAEDGGPVTLLRRSFALTRGESWRLLGFVALFLVAALAGAAAVSSVFGALIILLLGKPEAWTVSWALIALVGGLLQGVIALGWVTMLARCYAQLAAARPPA